MDDYPLIADHGLIGDLQTAALVSTNGTIDWFCAPRFDSPSIFGSLLDARTRRPTAACVRRSTCSRRKQLYLPDTAILITRFLTEEGVGEVVDFMPVDDGATATTNGTGSCGCVRCVRGTMTFEVDVAPRFDYGRDTHETELTDGRGRVPRRRRRR